MSHELITKNAALLLVRQLSNAAIQHWASVNGHSDRDEKVCRNKEYRAVQAVLKALNVEATEDEVWEVLTK